MVRFSVLAGSQSVGEPRMFMKTNQIVELTWNVTENKRLVRGPFPLKQKKMREKQSKNRLATEVLGSWNVVVSSSFPLPSHTPHILPSRDNRLFMVYYSY